MANTYGTWLPGDPRGFRTRKHREHVEGDYKSPPPAGVYEDRHYAAKERMTRDAVILPRAARALAVESIRCALVDFHKIEVIAIAVGGMHLHLLANFPLAQKATDSIRGLRATDPVRHYVGIAKKESAKRLVDAGHATPGGVWARKGKIVRIKDRKHQINAFNYILRHADEGAAVWSFRDQGKP
ncbi:MAG: hypothetical protein AB8C95_03540 [Phycisphaeraceae bacterium]